MHLLEHSFPFCQQNQRIIQASAVLKVVKLAGEQRHWTQYKTRVLIELKGRHSPRSCIAMANRIVTAIAALFAHVQHLVYGDLSPHQIPEELIKGNEVSVKDLEELEVRTGRDPYPYELFNRLSSCFVTTDQATATVFYLLPFVLQNENLFNACMFFRSCCSEYSFMDGVVRDVLDEPKQGPEDEIERLAFEHVVLQSFRTVEAVIGEPGKNVKRFRQHLQRWGIDYKERVGFPGHKKYMLEDRLRWLQSARDSATAHGRRRRPTPFTLFEVMEAQHLADLILNRALWGTAESRGREGDESEVAFLLEAMWPNYPGWARDKKLFRGKLAVDLARTPGGLGRILSLQKRRIEALYKRTPNTAR
jgi:hypothetical protein